MKGHHQRWLALVWLALCTYAAAFLFLFWEDHGPKGSPVAQADRIAARADFWPRPVEGTGTATSCDRDWRYLSATWRCTVDITAGTGEKVTQTIAHSQFTEVGRPQPVTLIGTTWEVADQPFEHRFAKTALVLLLAGGVALLAKPLYDLSRIRDLEHPGLPRQPLPPRTG
ncbi:hypothetical protein ACVDFE_40085 [Lentzea chajnantorensis]